MAVGEYVVLSQNESQVDHEQKEAELHLVQKKSSLILWAIGIIAACSLLDFVSLAYIASVPGLKLSTALPFDKLQFLSSYSHLDDVYTTEGIKASPRDPIINLPHVLAQVDSSAPANVQYPYPKMFSAHGGMIPFDERRTIVTPQISTVAEFHVMDYGMENCSLVLTIPPATNDTTSWMFDEAILLDVWALSWDQSIDTGRLSWNTKPQRGEHLGTLTMSFDTTQQIPTYSCKMGTYQNFEISCRTGPCNLQVFGNGDVDAVGMSFGPLAG
ncbi:hypothetical protein BU17DRAFT_88626 [Hysterangium stoloniferum]|nr:hypothetical protein BU17DRAFT_88626 [Hysterangium stoloniferum]